MHEPSGTLSPAAYAAGLHADLDEFDPAGLGSCSAEDLLNFWRDLDRFRNRLAALEHHVIAQARDRQLAFEYGARDVAALARQLLRLSSGDARGRVAAAEAAGPRRTATETLDPIYPAVAEAQASGVMSPAQARITVTTIEKLPDAVKAEYDRDIERLLVEQARDLDVDAFGRAAKHVADRMDPDGMLKDFAYRDRSRDLHLFPRRDGSAHIEGELTAECTERLQSVLESLDKPRPAADGVPDPRTGGQRRHDAFLDVLHTAQRSGELPTTSGIATTVILTMTEQAWLTGKGTARTAHGVTIPASEAVRWAGGDARIAAVVFDKAKNVTAYSGMHRIFHQSQRVVLLARDRGCTFPGCDVGPAWCQIHHVVEHNKGGPTTVPNGAMLCGHHHRNFEAMRWTSQLIDGRPHWIPPAWMDPSRRPRRNTLHDDPNEHTSAAEQPELLTRLSPRRGRVRT